MHNPMVLVSIGLIVGALVGFFVGHWLTMRKYTKATDPVGPVTKK